MMVLVQAHQAQMEHGKNFFCNKLTTLIGYMQSILWRYSTTQFLS